MDSLTVTQLTHILNEEAHMLSEELRHNGKNVNADVIVAKLDGLMARMKYELHKKDLQSTPYPFPIFDISPNPSSAYPDVLDYIYDKDYNKAYYPSIQRNQPKTAFIEYESESIIMPHPNPPSLHMTQSQHHNIDWYLLKPPKTYREPRKKSVEFALTPTTTRLRRSSTVTNPHTRLRSHSHARRDSNYLPISKSQKIVVNVIKDDSSSTKQLKFSKKHVSPARIKSQKSILKSSNNSKTKDIVLKRKVHTTASSARTSETTKETDEIVNKSKPMPPPTPAPQSKGKTERIAVINRRDYKSFDKKRSNSRRERLHTSKTHTTSPITTSNVPITPLSRYRMQQSTYYNPQPLMYPPPKMYTGVPSRANYPVPSFIPTANSFYSPVYYRY